MSKEKVDFGDPAARRAAAIPQDPPEAGGPARLMIRVAYWSRHERLALLILATSYLLLLGSRLRAEFVDEF